MEQKRLLTVDDLTQRSGFTRNTIRTMAKTGRMPAIRIAGQWRFDPDVIDAWLKRGGEIRTQ